MPSWDGSPTIPDPTALTATSTITTISTARAGPNPGTSTASQKALSTENVVYNIICHLEVDLMLQGRARRQALLSQLGRVSKAWTKPVYERVYRYVLMWTTSFSTVECCRTGSFYAKHRYTDPSCLLTLPACHGIRRNPYFGTADRAYRLYQSFGLTPTPVNVHGQAPLPARKDLIRKLIVGEGSSTDIEDWPTLQLVPDIIKAANNVEIIGFDGLHNVDLEAFKKALHSRKHLRELRGCGESARRELGTSSLCAKMADWFTGLL